MNEQRAYTLATVIIRVKLGNATDAERTVLLEWLDEREENRQVYKRIIRGEAIRERLQAEEKIRNKTDFECLRQRLVQALIGRRRKKILLRAVYGAAAACVIGVGIWLLGFYSLPEHRPVAELPINGKVKLILQSGKEIDLEKEIPQELDVENAVIVNRSGSLTYQAKETEELRKEVLNKIVTAVGGEYAFTLSDGTRVWLNAVSELEFPVDFVGEERVVRLNGEAYFEVSPDPGRPFFVETAGMRTRVLGTSFNVQAYANERSVSATLISGKVEVSLEAAPTTLVLEPGMASFWAKGTDRLTCKKVNVKNAIAWRYGGFVFDEEDIGVVMRMLSRWYGVEFVFDGGRKGKHTFSGKMSKDDSLDEVLEMITLAGGPEFRKEENRIYVIEK